jgi:hypothetical protein
MWSRFDLQDYQQSFAWLQATNRFRVYPNAVTYIGHIRINVDSPRMFGRRGFNLAVVDGDDDMRAHLVRAYPDYAHKLPYYKQITDLRRR